MKKIISVFAVTLVFLGLIFSQALAHDEDTPRLKKILKGLNRAAEQLEEIELPEIESTREHPTSFFAGPHGEVRIIRGEITALASATTTMTVRVWGLNLTVDISAARFLPQGVSASSLQVGDKVNIKGSISSQTGHITASLVHELSSRRRLSDELFSQIRRLVERLRELQQRAGLPLTPLPEPPATTTPQ